MDEQRRPVREDLFQPVLQDTLGSTATYDLGKLLYVAFFGGIMPTVILCTRNALWLRVERKWLYLLGSLSTLVWLSRVPYAILVGGGTIDRNGRLIYRILAVAIYFGYRWLMTPAYRQHLVLHGDTEPLLKPALITIFGVALVEMALGLLAATVVMPLVR